ncbi:MAG: hypothetical protein QMD71_06285 [bacterium]|nr:hypothetical protein [bacterium]
MAKLTKADILKGKNQVHTQYFEKLDGELDLRPLTEGEWAEIEATRASAGKVSGKPVFDKKGNIDRAATEKALEVEIDTKQTQLLDFEAKAMAVAFALSIDEQWTIDEVKQLRPVGVVEEIAEFVFNISGVSEEAIEQVRSFRKK